MEEWLKLSALLCFFGILREFRPSEPYITKYLKHPPMNFSSEVINRDIYPVATYSSVPLLIVVFLCTDIVRYKPIIILNGISGILIYLMLIVCREIFMIQIVEVLYGLFTACDVAYCTYIYAKVDKEHYQEVTSHVHGAYLIGRAISGISSQLLVSALHLSYYYLNFFTLGGMLLATIWACFLPKVPKSVYFHRRESTDMRESPLHVKNEGSKVIKIISKGFKHILIDLKVAFLRSYVLKWSFWWALATCGYYQILSYFQVLWEDITHDKEESKWNGAVEAAYTILSAFATFGCGKVKLDWNVYGEPTLAILSMCIGGILFMAAKTSNIFVAYAADIIAKIIYHAMITIANSEVAKNINPNSYALIFGINTFVALTLQSLLTLIVNSSLSLQARTQFIVYSCYFFGLGVLFLLIIIGSMLRKRNKSFRINKS